jgi:hypothetical protein
MRHTVAFELAKICSQVSRSSSLKPHRYMGWYCSWHLWLWACPWNALTDSESLLFAALSHIELAVTILDKLQPISLPMAWLSPKTSRSLLMVARGYFALVRIINNMISNHDDNLQLATAAHLSNCLNNSMSACREKDIGLFKNMHSVPISRISSFPMVSTRCGLFDSTFTRT